MTGRGNRRQGCREATGRGCWLCLRKTENACDRKKQPCWSQRKAFLAESTIKFVEQFQSISDQKGKMINVYFITTVHSHNNSSQNHQYEGQIHIYNTNKIAYLYKEALNLQPQKSQLMFPQIFNLPHPSITRYT